MAAGDSGRHKTPLAAYHSDVRQVRVRRFSHDRQDGTLDERANPWAKLWMSDIMSLQGLDEGDGLLGMNGDIRKLFNDDECRDMFMDIGMGQLRARSWARSVAPPGQEPVGVGGREVTSGTEDEGEPPAFASTYCD